MPSTRPGSPRRIGDLRPSPVTGELYLTDFVALARADGRSIGSIQVADDGTLDGINDRAQLAEATFAMQARINERAPPGRRDDARPDHGSRRRLGRSWPPT